jgi:hypothetical protein
MVKTEHRKGQTLAEFALTLPILLLLLFGIIEFGRLFQAWVSLQNSARAAARYASTGQPFNQRQTSINLDNIVPCISAANNRGTTTTVAGTSVGAPVTVFENNAVPAAQNESLFATWTGGIDCDPGRVESAAWRGDMVRMLMIYGEARRGAAGLFLEGPRYPVAPADVTQDNLRTFIHESFRRPMVGSTGAGWLGITICSGRNFLRSKAANESTHGLVDNSGRYVMDYDEPQPICRLNEIINNTNGSNAINNAGRSWMDPGDPGRPVNIVVMFNHPLITPIAPIVSTRDPDSGRYYIPMQARRTAINESYRATRAAESLGVPDGSIVSVPPTASPTLTPSHTPTLTLTPSHTSTATPTFTASPLPPFSCAGITVSNLELFQDRVFIDIRNANADPTELEQVSLVWPATVLGGDGVNPAPFSGMQVFSMTLDSEDIWQVASPTQARTSPVNTSVVTTGTWLTTSNRGISAGQTRIWEGRFRNGPNPLSDYVTIYDFANTKFWFDNPNTPATNLDCEIALTIATPTPTQTRNVNFTITPTPTNTGTPDCASSLLRVESVSFDNFGVVRLQVVNNRTVNGTLTGFTINWANLVTGPPGPNFAAGAITLRRVTIGGSGPADPSSYRVWDSGGGTQDASSPTRGGDNAPAEGVWSGNYNFPPRSTTFVYLDFDGIANRWSDNGGQWSDLNGSNFTIWCGQPGNTAGTSTGNSGQIFLNGTDGAPTNPPTPTRAPSDTPGPTRTPTFTFTPSRTPSPGPTNTPTRTPAATNTRPPTLTPSDTPLGGGGNTG